MNLLDAVILGIIEGVTEFLPVSSTFHLLWGSRLLNIGSDDFAKLFNVFIQSGAILSVVILYWKNLKSDFNLVKKTLAAFIPTVVLGVISYKTIKHVLFESYAGMLGIFVLVGILFLVFEYLVKKNLVRPTKAISVLTYKDALLVGLFQAFSFFPGVSRAGAVILALMFLGFRRADAAFFSFFLSIPTMLAAGLYDLYKTKDVLMSSGENILLLLAGFLTAFVVALFVVQWFISYLQKRTLTLFGFYRLMAGLAAAGFLLL